MLQSIVRAKAWIAALEDERFQSIEELAEVISLHPKVVRQQIQFAFLSPAMTHAILAEDLRDVGSVSTNWPGSL